MDPQRLQPQPPLHGTLDVGNLGNRTESVIRHLMALDAKFTGLTVCVYSDAPHLKALIKQCRKSLKSVELNMLYGSTLLPFLRPVVPNFDLDIRYRG